MSEESLCYGSWSAVAGIDEKGGKGGHCFL